jgi:uncharacterized LabA/DUF88 family protein
MAKTSAERLEELRSLFVGNTHVYIDFANVRKHCAQLGWAMDLRKLKTLLGSTGKVKSARVYFGTIVGDRGSEGFATRIRKEGFELITKPVKFIDISMNASSVSHQSTHILANFVDQSLIRLLKVEAVEYLNHQLIALNKEGKYSLQKMKCNFDVEIATDMRLDHALKRCQTFCLWSGDSDFAHPILQLLNDNKNVVVVSKGISTEVRDLKPEGMIHYDLRKLTDVISLSPEKQRGLR